MAKKKRIIKNGYIAVVSDDKLETAEFDDYEYEHRVVAEEMLDRPLKEGEQVHHLDENRENNSPDNLLVLSGPMHAKLHTWLNKNIITPKPEYAKRIERGCVRCKMCDKPIDHTMTYCSNDCYVLDERLEYRRYEHPTKEVLEQLVWAKPTTEVAAHFGVSDKAIEKLCKKLEVVKPPRGHWAKVEAGKFCLLK